MRGVVLVIWFADMRHEKGGAAQLGLFTEQGTIYHENGTTSTIYHCVTFISIHIVKQSLNGYLILF